MATLEAMLAPKQFSSKGKDPEQLLIDFDLYIKTVNNYLLAVEKEQASSKVKLATLQALGGPDMVDLLEHVGKVVLTNTPAIAADPDNNVAAVPGTPADSYEDGIDKIRKGIVARTNQAMSRLKLFQQMPQGQQAFGEWSQEIFKQAKRCDWDGYDSPKAARDAILYQTKDSRLRKKILAENLTFEQTVQWGRTNEASSKKAKDVEAIAQKLEAETLRETVAEVNRLKEKDRGLDKVACRTCPYKQHKGGQKCPGLSGTCFDCGKEGHFKGAKCCRKKKASSKKEETKPTKPYYKRNKKDKHPIHRVDSDDSSVDGSFSDSSSSSVGRVEEVVVAKFKDGGKENLSTTVEVSVRPYKGGGKLLVQWTPDSGVRRTLLSEKDWNMLKERNKNLKLKANSITFRPYGTNISLKVLGKLKLILKNRAGKKIKSTVFVIGDSTESLLGEIDGKALGIIKLNPRGDPSTDLSVKSIAARETSKGKEETASGGETQEQIDANMNLLVNDFPSLFKGIGKAKVPPISFKVKDNAKPITQKLRPVPINLMAKLKENLDNFVEEGILEGPLGPEHGTGWLHNIVIAAKKWDPSKIRITLDTRALNKVLQKGEYPIPTAEQLRHNFGKSDRFSSIDCNHAFFQFELDEETQKLFYAISPYGIYKFKRMVMGAPPASGECHAKMAAIIQGLDGVEQIKDDLVVHGKGKIHDARLKALFIRLKEYGITLRREKCEFGKPEVHWFGNTFNKHGMMADTEKVATVKSWPEPTDKSGVKSFLQTAQFLAPFMRSRKRGRTFADITAPLRRLTGKGTHFRWGKEEKLAFENVKECLVEDLVLTHYEPNRKTRVYVDHGPKGLGAMLAQLYEVPGEPKKCWKPVLHTSRVMSQTEMNYGKTEGESLAIFSGIMRLKNYLYGTDFEVVTDHKPLVPLYNHPTRPAPTRVERHRGKLRQFSFEVKYEPGSTSPADYGSRNPGNCSDRDKDTVEGEKDEETILINRINDISNSTAVSTSDIIRQYGKDDTLKQLLQDVTTGVQSEMVRNSPYSKVFSELAVVDGVIVRGDRVVIPMYFVPRVIAAAHEGHMGIEKTIQNVRERCWFPLLSKLCKEFVETCHPGCSSAVRQVSPPEIQEKKEATRPWQVCHADFKGPIGGPRGYYFHVLIDEYSKWPEIAVTKSTNFESLFPVVERSFATHGIPEKIIHDNGAPYNSEAWKKFAKASGFIAQGCTPEHPQANGLAEKMMSSIVKLVHASLAEKKDPKIEIFRFLLNYRNTPHPSTGFTPSRLLMGRIIKTKIPALILKPTGKEHEEAQENNKEAKKKAKAYADKRRKAKDREVKVGDNILIAQDKSTIKQPFDPHPYKVTKVSHAQVTAERGGRKRVRNLGKCKIIKDRPGYLRDKDHKDKRRQRYDSDSDLSDFDCVEETEIPDVRESQLAVHNGNQIQVEEGNVVVIDEGQVPGEQVPVEEGLDVVMDERQVPEDGLLEVGIEGNSEEEEGFAPPREERRPRRERKKPDLYGDWEYEREEEEESE